MAVETKEHVIGEYAYQIQMLGAALGKKVFMRLVRVVAPAVEAESVAKFAELLTDEQLDFLCDTFAKVTQFSPVDDPSKQFALSTKGLFDSHFAGKYGEMMKWLWACIETNYESFFAEMGLTPELLKHLTSLNGLTPTPANPTGSSGASSIKDGAL